MRQRVEWDGFFTGLAYRYGWSHEQILELTPSQIKLYLEALEHNSGSGNGNGLKSVAEGLDSLQARREWT